MKVLKAASIASLMAIPLLFVPKVGYSVFSGIESKVATSVSRPARQSFCTGVGKKLSAFYKRLGSIRRKDLSKMTITIEEWNGNKYTVTVGSKDSYVWHVLENLANQTGRKTSNFVLIVNGTRVFGNQRLIDVGIQDGTIVHSKVQLGGGLISIIPKGKVKEAAIFPKTGHSEIHLFFGETFEALKQQIADETGLSVDSITFENDGEPYDDARTLSSYGIEQNSVIYMSLVYSPS